MCLGDTDVRKYNLLWCDKTPKGKRNKPSKINGVQHHEIKCGRTARTTNNVQ